MPREKKAPPDQRDPLAKAHDRIAKLEKALSHAIVAINRWGARAQTFVELQTLQKDIDSATEALTSDE